MKRNISVILTLQTLTSYVIVGVQWAQASVSTSSPTSIGNVITVIAPSGSLSAPTSSGYVITPNGSPSSPTSNGYVITPTGSTSAPTSSGYVITPSGSPSALTSTPTAEITTKPTTPCACDKIGANETSCHPETGKCSCRENVTGLQCNRCLENYYNFNSGAGCSPCNCHANYASNLQCDGNSGICSCKPGILGGKCTGCADQFYNLTVQGCRSCECNLLGTLNFVCNKTTGQCPCKAHSRGRQCDTCPPGFYGLNANHSEGCLKCQCANKSSDCVSDPGWFVSLINTSLSVRTDNTNNDGWTAVNSVGSSVLVELDWSFLISNFEKALMKVDTSGSDALYFVAPAKYLGDQRFAYTFTLSFVLQQDDASNPASSSRGDVILESKWFNQPLVTCLSSPPPGGNSYTRYKVRFVESDWRVGNTTGRQPTSYEMIAVLSHLTSLRIRAKWTATTTQLYTRLGDIALTVSNRTSVITPPQNASNVERCSCPREYKGQFCEQCSDGYTRSTPNGGPYVTCVFCQCNGHSCDPETGVCHNTTEPPMPTTEEITRKPTTEPPMPTTEEITRKPTTEPPMPTTQITTTPTPAIWLA